MRTESDYTLFLDETGDHTMGVSGDLGKRYLGIAAPFVHRDHMQNLDAEVEAIKRKHLRGNGSVPVLHRKEIMQCRGPFTCLVDTGKREAFDRDLVALISSVPYTLVAVAIDKSQHGTKKYRSLQHPYHYCLHAILERFCGFLDYLNKTGQVMAEARGKVEDRLLCDVYRAVYRNGTSYLAAKTVQKTLVSSELEIRRKNENISGLQLADMLAHPATRDVLVSYGRLDCHGTPFTESIVAAIKPKYNRRRDIGTVKGYGKILLS